MIRIHLIIAAWAIALPGVAMAQHQPEETSDHHMAGHEHHEHDAHEVDGNGPNEDETGEPNAAITRTNDIDIALAAGGEPVVADVLGVVCDFCAKAMNKVFGKRSEVAAVYVDLDSKTLSLVVKDEMSLSDEEISRLVKKAGYRVAMIRRGEAALRGTDNEADPS